MARAINKSTLIWIIVILAVTNISTIGTIAYRVYFQENTAAIEEEEEIEVPDGRKGRFFRDELGLDNEQHLKFRAFRRNFHRQANRITHELNIKRSDLIAELGKENTDTTALHTLASEIGNLHTDLKHLTFEYYLEMKDVCNDEQNKKLFRIFNAMINSEADMKFTGRKRNK